MKDRFSREVRIEILGEERRFLLCMKGLKEAKARGYDIEDLELGEEEAKEKAEDGIDQLRDLMWVGLLPFYDIDLEMIEFASFGDMARFREKLPKIAEHQMTSEIKEEVQSGQGAEGKA
jgi:hypothetical protein